MNPKELDQSYQEKKDVFHKYIDDIKKKSKWNLYTIINPTLIKNPYASSFPKHYFSNKIKNQNKILQFIKSTIKFYIKNIYLLCSYFIAFALYKIYYKKKRKYDIENIIDVFVLVDKVNEKGKFSENYLSGVYEIFEKYQVPYTILLRPYGVGKAPLKLKNFFEITHQDKKDFIFEYDFLKFRDFIELLKLIILYPFKILRLKQKKQNLVDEIFNNAFISDLQFFSFDSITRYILGKNLSKIKTIKKIYSWSEFQVIERSFNYAVRKNSSSIELIGLQFYLNYDTYFNAYADDLDYDMLSSPHKMLVNGKYYVKNREKVKYDVGVSLRYKDIFTFEGIKEEKNILLLGSYIERDTKYMLESVREFDNVIFKNHPAVDIKRFRELPKSIKVSSENIYKLFENVKLVIATASGTAVEAVACGISVIIIASQDNLTANPLIEYGKGKIWDIAFNQDDINFIYNNLIQYRQENPKEIQEIAQWYKDNFFAEPTEENIVKVFELNKERR